jgi:hypothetical protein
MFSGLERQCVAHCRQKRVTWAWIKARGVMDCQPAPAHSMLTTSVLSINDSAPTMEAASWRDSDAAITYHKLARQICEQFYDLSIFHAWRSRGPDAVATSRMLSPALPSYCRDAGSARKESVDAQRLKKARILTAVLPDQSERRGAVLLTLKSKAA